MKFLTLDAEIKILNKKTFSLCKTGLNFPFSYKAL